jgi:hypothetical protein
LEVVARVLKFAQLYSNALAINSGDKRSGLHDFAEEILYACHESTKATVTLVLTLCKILEVLTPASEAPQSLE